MTLKLTVNQIFEQALNAHKEGRLQDAERLYHEVLKIQPEHLVSYNNLGILLHGLGRLKEAEASYKKAIELKPDYAETYNNLGWTLNTQNRFEEAEVNLRQAITLKPDYAEAYYNIGFTFYKSNKLDQAEISYKKAIEIKSDYSEAHNSLGVTLQSFRRFIEAKKCFEKAIKINNNNEEAKINLEVMLSQNKLLDIIKVEDLKKKNKNNFLKIIFSKLFDVNVNTNQLNHTKKISSNPFITNRKVETELISQLYKINTKKLNDVNPNIDPRYGNGRNSDYYLFENNFPIIKTVEKDLINIMKEAVKSDIFISESFFNIFHSNSGIVEHNHINDFDEYNNLINKKFSLSYYLNIGDQNCSEPGILRLQDPAKEILPTEGLIVMFPAVRKHSAVYSGKKDRVMIGVNFYTIP